MATFTVKLDHNKFGTCSHAFYGKNHVTYYNFRPKPHTNLPPCDILLVKKTSAGLVFRAKGFDDE